MKNVKVFRFFRGSESSGGGGGKWAKEQLKMFADKQVKISEKNEKSQDVHLRPQTDGKSLSLPSGSFDCGILLGALPTM